MSGRQAAASLYAMSPPPEHARVTRKPRQSASVSKLTVLVPVPSV